MPRTLGLKLDLQGRLLMQFIDYLEGCGAETVTTEAAIPWATAPGHASPVCTGCVSASPGASACTSISSTLAARFEPAEVACGRRNRRTC